MNEVVAKASKYPSFIFCLDLDFQVLRTGTYASGKQKSHTPESESGLWHLQYSLGKVIQAVSLILYLKDRIFTEW